jgi:hypothetical protein
MDMKCDVKNENDIKCVSEYHGRHLSFSYLVAGVFFLQGSWVFKSVLIFVLKRELSTLLSIISIYC